MVVYPHGVHPLFVGTPSSIEALDSAMSGDKQILLLAKRDAEVDTPGRADLFEVGTIATVLQLLKLPDGTVKALVEGGSRARLTGFEPQGSYFVADVDLIPEPVIEGHEGEALARTLLSQFEQFVQQSKKVPQEIIASLSSIDDPARLTDTIAAQMSLNIANKQTVLETSDLKERMDLILAVIDDEIEVYQMEKGIRGRVKKQMEKSQREYYLNEQMKAIQKELGDLEETPNEIDALRDQIEKNGLSKRAAS